MELHFLGRGAAFNPLEKSTSAYVKEGDRLLLLDCGESVFAELIRRGLLQSAKEVWIAVSHLHSDHSGSLGSVTLYCTEILKFKAKLLLPTGDERYERELHQLLNLFGVSDSLVDYVPETALTGFSAFSSFRFCRTKHAPQMVCYSFAFDTPEGGVYYTADSAVADGIAAFIASHPDYERIYAETIDAPSHPVHLPLHVLAELIPEGQRGKVSMMHLNGANAEASARALGFDVVTVG